MAAIPTQTLSRFILSEQRRHAGTTGELSDLLSTIALGVKVIGHLVQTAGFKGLYGYTGRTNVQGEQVQLLDEEADEVLMQLLSSSGHFGLLVSEERDTVVATEMDRAEAKYIIAIDPLDGSSNIGSNIPVGTIFAIWRKPDAKRTAAAGDFLQSGRKLIAAGYAVYGARTVFVYSSGNGVHGFTLDPSLGEFVLTDERIEMPERGSTYSVNEGYCERWTPSIRSFVDGLKTADTNRRTPYSSRYVGSLVADFDRNLRRGGIFLYPADTKSPNGKLRLLYECIPLAYIAEQAGGAATDGRREILDIVPSDIHERTPFVVGSRTEVNWFREHNK